MAACLQANIDVLKRHDPVAAQSLLHTQKLPQSQFDALMELQNQPAGTSREAFVQQAVQQLLVSETAWQCASFDQVSQLEMIVDFLTLWKLCDFFRHGHSAGSVAKPAAPQGRWPAGVLVCCLERSAAQLARVQRRPAGHSLWRWPGEECQQQAAAGGLQGGAGPRAEGTEQPASRVLLGGGTTAFRRGLST